MRILSESAIRWATDAGVLLEPVYELASCAPTKRAATRLSEATGMKAKTTRRLLEVRRSTGRFGRNESHPLDCDLLVMDEAPIADVGLMQGVLKAIPLRASLILIGDVDQLPSEGPGYVFKNLIDCGLVSVVRLTEALQRTALSRIDLPSPSSPESPQPPLPAPEFGLSASVSQSVAQSTHGIEEPLAPSGLVSVVRLTEALQEVPAARPPTAAPAEAPDAQKRAEPPENRLPAREPPPAPEKKRPGRHPGELVDGQKLRKYRIDWSQQDFAEKCGLSLATIQRAESGERWSAGTFEKVASTLTVLTGGNMTPQDLKKKVFVYRPDRPLK